MEHATLIRLAGILVLGVLSQWVAWRVRLPSILILLATGTLAGPVLGWLQPDVLFGDLLAPLVSLSVGVILYEGGLNLKFRDLRSIGGAFVLLTTLGAGLTWLVGTLAAHYVAGLDWPVATLLGAILIVTGPTVIGPIVRHLHLRGKVGSLLKWEGIIIDPIGATLAVLVFTVVRVGASPEGFGEAARSLGMTLVVGTSAGLLAAGVLVVALGRFWVPDPLHNPVSLMLVFVALTAADAVQAESGLLAVTVMGIALANQKRVSIRHVIEFKETLTVLLISCLFIVLSARLRPEALRGLGWESFAFAAVMMLVARPVSVLASTLGSSLTWRERAFLCFMAPRGIVAAAISSVFALNLLAAGHPQAMEIVPLTFLLVFVTVLLYGLGAGPLARWLGLVEANPQGILFVGADAWTRALASALYKEKCSVFLVDTNWENIRAARMEGLPCLYGSALAEQTRDEVDFTGIGRMLALTSNSEVNSLACLSYAEDFGRREVYQLPFPSTKEGRHEVVPLERRGRLLFGHDSTSAQLTEMLKGDFKIKTTKLTNVFDTKAFHEEHGEAAVPFFVIRPDGAVLVRTVDGLPDLKPGNLLVSIVPSRDRAGRAPAEVAESPAAED